MGVHKNISADKFPKQGNYLSRSKVRVCFNYDTSKTFEAVCVREDDEDPRITIFRLSDGRYVLATECMYSWDEPSTALDGGSSDESV